MQVLVNEDARMVVDGVEYHAVTHDPSCTGCAARLRGGLCSVLGRNCRACDRIDETPVIWVRAK